MDPAHSSGDQDLLVAENEELRDLCCYLDDDRLRLKQSAQKWKDRYYQLYVSSKRQYRCCGPINGQHSTELKETVKQVNACPERAYACVTAPGGALYKSIINELYIIILQLYDLKVQVERDLHHHRQYSQGSPNTQGAKSGMNVMCELILLDNLISVRVHDTADQSTTTNLYSKHVHFSYLAGSMAGVGPEATASLMLFWIKTRHKTVLWSFILVQQIGNQT